MTEVYDPRQYGEPLAQVSSNNQERAFDEVVTAHPANAYVHSPLTEDLALLRDPNYQAYIERFQVILGDLNIPELEQQTIMGAVMQALLVDRRALRLQRLEQSQDTDT